MRVGRISSYLINRVWRVNNSEKKYIYSWMFKFYLGKKEGGKNSLEIGHNLTFLPSFTNVRKASIDVNVALFVNFETISSRIQNEEWRMEYILILLCLQIFAKICDMDNFVPCLTKKLMALLGESWERGRGRDSLLGALYSKDLPVPFKKR